MTDKEIEDLAERFKDRYEAPDGGFRSSFDLISFARAIEQAARATAADQSVLEGWKLVPVEPTDDMEAAAEDDYERTGATFPDWKSVYRAMIAAIESQRSGEGEPS
jgi:hypothetical protein